MAQSKVHGLWSDVPRGALEWAGLGTSTLWRMCWNEEKDALKLRGRRPAAGCRHCLQGWEWGASLVCVGSTRGKPRPWERCWARNFTSHPPWGRDNGLGSQPQRGDGCSVLGLERRRELQGLCFPPSGWNCTAWLLVSAPFPYFKRAVLMCVQSARWWCAKKKAWKHEGGGISMSLPGTWGNLTSEIAVSCRRTRGWCSLDYGNWDCGIH